MAENKNMASLLNSSVKSWAISDDGKFCRVHFSGQEDAGTYQILSDGAIKQTFISNWEEIMPEEIVSSKQLGVVVKEALQKQKNVQLFKYVDDVLFVAQENSLSAFEMKNIDSGLENGWNNLQNEDLSALVSSIATERNVRLVEMKNLAESSKPIALQLECGAIYWLLENVARTCEK